MSVLLTRDGVMPNRIIRESCRSSKTLAKVGGDAERLFWRLTTVADDYGRFDADPQVVRSDCFKVMDWVKTTQVIKWLGELGKADLIRLYDAQGKRYGFFTTWFDHQRRRDSKSKWPEPEVAAARGNLPPLAATCGDSRLARAPASGGMGYGAEGMERSRRVVLSDDQFVSALKSNDAYKGIDLDLELARMDAWLLTPKARGRKKTRQFVVNWLNRCDRPITATAPLSPPPPRYRNPNHFRGCICERCKGAVDNEP